MGHGECKLRNPFNVVYCCCACIFALVLIICSAGNN